MPSPIRRVTTVAFIVLFISIAACRLGSSSAGPVGAGALSSSPSPTGSVTAPATGVTTTPSVSATPRVTVTPHVSPTVHVTVTPTTRRPLPDLTIGLARVNACTWYTDALGDVWLNPLLEVFATGTVPATVSFNMVSNWSKHTAGGGLTPHVAQTWAIDISQGSSLPALGHVVNLTVTVDPTHEVAESNEGNNVTTISVNLVGISSPPGHDPGPVTCS